MEKDQKIKFQLSQLNKINASDNDILELKINIQTGVEEMVEVSRKNISLNGKAVWEGVRFKSKIPFLEFKKLLSKKPFSELNSDDLLNSDLKFDWQTDGRFEWHSINGESDLDEIVKALKGTPYEYKPESEKNEKEHIDRVADHIWNNCDQEYDDDYESEYKFQTITSLETENHPFYIRDSYWTDLQKRAGELSRKDAFSESNSLLEEFLDWEKDEGERILAYEKMAKNYLSLEAYDKAIESLNSVIKLGGENYNTYRVLGETHFKLKNYDEAINAYRKASELNKSGVEDYLTYSNLGVSYFTLKNYDEAINAYRKASELNQDHFYPDWMLARIFKEKKQYSEALEHINIAINRDSLSEVSNAANNQFYNIRGDINVDLGNFQDAIEDFKQESSLNPNYGYPVYRLGHLLFETKNYEESYHHLQKAQSLDERMKSYDLIWYLRGLCLYHLKEYVKAYKELEKASSLGNKHAEKFKEKIKEMKDIDISDKDGDASQTLDSKEENTEDSNETPEDEEEDHEYLFQYHKDWVLYEMEDEEVEEHILQLGTYYDLWLDDMGIEEPTTGSEFWDTLIELNKLTDGKGEDA